MSFEEQVLLVPKNHTVLLGMQLNRKNKVNVLPHKTMPSWILPPTNINLHIIYIWWFKTKKKKETFHICFLLIRQGQERSKHLLEELPTSTAPGSWPPHLYPLFLWTFALPFGNLLKLPPTVQPSVSGYLFFQISTDGQVSKKISML